MTVILEPGAADECSRACAEFVSAVRLLSTDDYVDAQLSSSGSFPTARQIGAVYSLFAGEDLRTLLNGFVDQVDAMSMLFAAAGGLIEAQDEAVAAALGKASAEPAGLQSLGLLAGADTGSLGSLTGMIDASIGAVGGYERVGYENVDGATLDWMVSGAQALNPQEFDAIRTKATEIADGLRTAGDALHWGLTDQLSGPWQGEFATQALAALRPFSQSVTDLAGALDEVSDKATHIGNGFSATQRRMTETAATFDSARASAIRQGSAVPSLLPPTDDAQSALNQSRAAAEQQARATINTEYSPAVMRGNLADLDIPAPYRVVSLPTLGGPGGVDLVSAWNVDGVIQPATAGTPSAAALAAATGGGAEVGIASGGTAGGAPMGATTSPPTAPTDAATEQALLASRTGAADGAGAIAASAGQAGAGGGVNASTTAAGAPFAPAATASRQQSGAGGSGIRGVRGGVSSGRDRDRGFGSAAGLVGGGGAAAAGAAASRMGGAGTLAGIGGGAGMGGGVAGGAGAGAFGAGSASAGAAGSGAGAVSSSGGAQAGRAGAMPMGAMAGAAGAGQNSDRRGHTPAGYLTNATNTTAIIGEPLKVSPAVLGRKTVEDPSAPEAKPEPFRGRVIGRDYTGRGAR